MLRWVNIEFSSRLRFLDATIFGVGPKFVTNTDKSRGHSMGISMTGIPPTILKNIYFESLNGYRRPL